MLNVLNEIEAAKGNQKQVVMVDMAKIPVLSRVFQKVAYLAYNSAYTYDLRLPEYVDLVDELGSRANPNAIPVSLEESLIRLEEQFRFEPATNERKERILDMMANMDVEDAEVFCRVINRDLRIGCGISTINKVFPKLIPTFSLMACQGLNEKTAKLVKPGWYAQLKYDAARIAIIVTKHKISYFTRNGKTYNIKNETLEAILLEMRAFTGHDIMLDGEIFQYDKTGGFEDRKFSNGVSNKLIQDTATDEMQNNIGIAVWDLIPTTVFELPSSPKNDVYQWRLDELTSAYHVAINNLNLRGEDKLVLTMAETVAIDSIEEGIAIGKKFIADGFEGAIIKDPKAKWEPRRSKGALKIKAIREADLRIVDIVEGTGRLRGRLGAVVCESECGTVKVNVGSGFKDDERDLDTSLIGKVISVLYNEIIKAKDSDTYSLFLPRMTEVRFDKTEADTYDKIMKEY